MMTNRGMNPSSFALFYLGYNSQAKRIIEVCALLDSRLYPA
jgi:hypothetical protein